MRVRAKIQQFRTIQSRIDTLHVPLNESIAQEQKQILEVRKSEILLGRNSDGQPFLSYLQDPYFGSHLAAQHYMEWKEDQVRNHNMRIFYPLNYPNKAKETPNLIIRGDFHDSIFIRVYQGSFEINSNWAYWYWDGDRWVGVQAAREMDKKYEHKLFPLGPLGREYVYNNFVKPKMRIWLGYKR